MRVGYSPLYIYYEPLVMYSHRVWEYTSSMGIAVKFGINTTSVTLKFPFSMQQEWYLSQISLLVGFVLWCIFAIQLPQFYSYRYEFTVIYSILIREQAS